MIQPAGARPARATISRARPLALAPIGIVFDTRVNGVGVFTGRASRRIAKLLRRHGYRLVAAPQSFLVCSHNTLLDGEASWARRWA
jgi:hypothetical protein